MTKVDFAILSHENPEQLRMLLAKLQNEFPESAIAIHHDGDRPRETADDRVVWLPPIPTKWGHFSLVEATLWLFHVLLHMDRPPDWIVLLSGTSYPIQPSSVIVDHFANCGHDAQMDIRRLSLSERDEDMHDYPERFMSRSFWPGYYLPARRPSWRRLELTSAWATRGLPFSTSYHCYAGSQWFAASRRAASLLLELHHPQSRLARHYARRFGSDESYLHTILGNAPHISILAEGTHYVEFEPVLNPFGRPINDTPRVLTYRDAEAVLHSNYLFARKFDAERSRDLLELIDQRKDISGVDHQPI